MTPFAQSIKSAILENGPMRVETFMGLALAQYYSTRDPLGAAGDFTTAPEISQMFGEMIGVFLADAWLKMGSPKAVQLVEAGPGRGTLMADILRATKTVPGFHDAMDIVLVEMSPTLRDRQRQALDKFSVRWCEFLSDPIIQESDYPIMFVANEFLDALPICQYVVQGPQCFERVVGLEGEQFVFGQIPAHTDLPKGNGVFERSPAREGFAQDLSRLIADRGGVGLLIDYGHDRSGFGDTLQAVKAHQFVDVLDHIGEADLTSHVDFEALRTCAEKHVMVHGPVGQGDFLKNLGIDLRAEKLNQSVELARLTAADQMGDLFRVMALCHDRTIRLAGFA